jgi:hypothetical protein
MKEIDYINATNLAKLIIASHSIGDCLFMDADEKALFIKALTEITNLIELMQKKVKID